MDRSGRSSDRKRRLGLLPLARLPLPPGAPGPLHRAAREARVRQALGVALAGQVVGVEFEGGSVVIVFAGTGWERALSNSLGGIAQRVAAALGRPSVTIEVRSDPRRNVTSSFHPAGTSVDSGRDSQDPLSRLRRAAERILARRERPR